MVDLAPELAIRQLVFVWSPGPLLAIPQSDLLVLDRAATVSILRQHPFGVSWIPHCELCSLGGETELICATSALSGCIRLFGQSSTTFVMALGEAVSRVRTILFIEVSKW